MFWCECGIRIRFEIHGVNPLSYLEIPSLSKFGNLKEDCDYLLSCIKIKIIDF